MQPRGTGHMFQWSIEKTADEIKQKASAKIDFLKKKIEERQGRVDRLREEYQIDDKAFIQLLQAARKQAGAERFSYTHNSVTPAGQNQMEEKTIGAGVVNNLLTESDFIESERSDVRRLSTIVRNLRPLPRVTTTGATYEENTFGVSHEELEFLGF